MKDWSELPLDILDLFVQRLSMKEFIRFSCVCKSWRCAAVLEKNTTQRFGPWLIFADAVNDDTQREAGGVRRCFSLSSREIFRLPSPQLQGRRGWGTPHGWVITFGLDFDIHLFHPLTQRQIPLPPQSKFKLRERDHGFSEIDPPNVCRLFFTKFALSSTPSDSTRVPCVMALHGGSRDLSFASPGDEAWTPLTVLSEPSSKDDIIFYKDHFYSIDFTGELSVCNINAATEPEEKPIASISITFPYPNLFYLSEISGDLHLICRTFEFIEGEDYTEFHYVTKDFFVYKFDFNKIEWVGVKDLNGQALFVGNNTSYAVSASKYPVLKPNWIYFTDDTSDYYQNGFCDMGVYDFETKTLLDHLCKRENSISYFGRPFFFMP